MKTIGLIGGTGWASSIEYYRFLNEETHRRLGGNQFSKCILYSLNFHDVVVLTQQNKSVLPLLVNATEKLISAGADCLLLCANTMHKYVDDLQSRISKPIIHIAVETAKVIQEKRLSKVGLIGSKPTMEMDFFKSKLHKNNINCVVPNEGDREILHSIVMDEMAKGLFTEKSQERTLKIIRLMEGEGIEGIILGCTEFPILLQDKKFSYPVFNTTEIHANAAVDFALKNINV